MFSYLHGKLSCLVLFRDKTYHLVTLLDDDFMHHVFCKVWMNEPTYDGCLSVQFLEALTWWLISTCSKYHRLQFLRLQYCSLSDRVVQMDDWMMKSDANWLKYGLTIASDLMKVHGRLINVSDRVTHKNIPISQYGYSLQIARILLTLSAWRYQSST